MSILIAPAAAFAASAVVSAELLVAPASPAVRARCLAELAPCSQLGLWVSDSDESEFGLRCSGPVAAVLAALSVLQPFGEAVAVAPFVFGPSGGESRSVWG